MTLTPGIFFHASRDLQIEEFEAQFDDGHSVAPAVWFSEVPNYAITCGVARWGTKGRLYRCKLDIRNPFFMTDSDWQARYVNSDNFTDEDAAQWEQENIAMCFKARSEGYDSIIYHVQGVIIEAAVLRDGVASSVERAGPVIGSRKAQFPLYCDRSIWPRIDLEALRSPANPENTHFDYLVDPRDGHAMPLTKRKKGRTR